MLDVYHPLRYPLEWAVSLATPENLQLLGRGSASRTLLPVSLCKMRAQRGVPSMSHSAWNVKFQCVVSSKTVFPILYMPWLAVISPWGLTSTLH